MTNDSNKPKNQYHYTQRHTRKTRKMGTITGGAVECIIEGITPLVDTIGTPEGVMAS